MRRSVSNPKPVSASVRPTDGASPERPAGSDFRPTQITPFMKVPVVSTTAGARKLIPQKVLTPVTSSFAPISMSVTIASRMDRFSVFSSTLRISLAYCSLSVCARSAHTAGPLEELRMRFWR